MLSHQTIRLSLPSKGRLEIDASEFLAAAGLNIFKPNPRQYQAELPALPELGVIFQRPGDIVVSVRQGSIDFGLTGLDMIEEKRGDNDEIIILHDSLGFGGCTLMLAVPESWKEVTDIASLKTYAADMKTPLRVATKFPVLTERFLNQHNISHNLISAEGTLESAPTIGYADMISDLVSSGQTLADNRLRPLSDGVIQKSQAVLIANRKALQTRPDVLEMARRLLEYIEAHLRAKDNLLVIANMRGDSAEVITQKIFNETKFGGLQGPTISPIGVRDGSPNWYSVSIVVRRDLLPQAISQLRLIGGSGIIVSPLTYIFEEEPPRYKAMLKALDKESIMLKQYDPQTAKQTILKRTPPDEFPVSQSVLDGITKLFGEALTPEQAVTRILKDVRANGDSALQKWTLTLDSFDRPPAPVSPESIRSALDSISPRNETLLTKAAARIEAFHRRQPLTSWFTNELGGTLGQIIRPIERVGLYVPGGTAPLPSTVLMSAIPARVAGVKEIIVVTPPNRSVENKELPVSPMILAACAIAGVDKVYLLGGAQAIAALAYGTETIQPVSKIFGPGNLFVTLAKRQVYGVVGIDGLAGPTETVVIADESANPAWVAADLLAQAEHDLLASAILLTPSKTLIEKVEIEVGKQIELRGRADTILASLENRGGAVLTRDLAEAVQLANDYAPEHLALSVTEPWAWVEKVNNAGGVFVGEHSFEVLGDYLAGPSHVMPTGGSAKFASPLNVWDFIKIVSLVALDGQTVDAIGPIAATIAEAEGLDAHQHAALVRLETQV